MRRALAGTALIEKYNAIDVGIEVATIIVNQSAPWSSMKKDHGPTLWISHLLIVKLVNRRDSQPARRKRCYLRI
jgi:hypothetical protein